MIVELDGEHHSKAVDQNSNNVPFRPVPSLFQRINFLPTT